MTEPALYEDGPPSNPRNESAGERLLMRGSYGFGMHELRTYARTSFELHYRLPAADFAAARSA